MQNDIVESIDIFPTLVELCGFDKSPLMDGDSLLSLMEGENKKEGLAFGVLAEGGWRKDKPLGYTLRTERYRIVIWKDRNNGKWLDFCELYDHQKDKNETDNIAEQSPELVKTLKDKLLSYIKVPGDK